MKDTIRFVLGLLLLPFIVIFDEIKRDIAARKMLKIWKQNSFPYYDEQGIYKGNFSKHYYKVENGKLVEIK